MNSQNNKLIGRFVVIGILSVIIISGVVLFPKLSLTGFAIQSNSESQIEKSIQIEVFADTEIIVDENLETQIVLDNGTVLHEGEIEFTLEDLSKLEIINSDGYTRPNFDLYNVNPGSYSLTIVFQGSDNLHLNPSEIEKQVEVIEENSVKKLKEKKRNFGSGTGSTTLNTENENQDETGALVKEENETVENNNTIIDEQNESTTISFIAPTNLECYEFTEDILWTSDFTFETNGSTNYQTWNLKYNCLDINSSNCFIGNLELQTRFLYFGDSNQNGEGYIQISNPDESICSNPENGIYEKYLAYETLKGDERKLGQYCGNNKNQDSKCGVDFENSQSYNKNCYGIKAHADPQFIVDAFEVKYHLCKLKEDST